jgi:hypothetical protein
MIIAKAVMHTGWPRAAPAHLDPRYSSYRYIQSPERSPPFTEQIAQSEPEARDPPLWEEVAA